VTHRSTFAALAAILALAGAVAGCTIGDQVGPTQVVTISQPTPSPTPLPTASPSPAASAIPAGSYVRVGMFSCSCPGSGACSNNGAATLQVGCTAELTATPKAPDGSDLPASVHGPNVTWSFVGQGSLVSCAQWAGEPFNVSCRALSAGAAGISAAVPGMQPGSVTLTVIP
jgi:hypothetical protein